MRIYDNPARSEWAALCRRSLPDDAAIEERVADILERVRKDGDGALKALSQEIEGFVPESFVVSAEEMEEAARLLPENLKAAIRVAAARIEEFHGRRSHPKLQLQCKQQQV